MGAASSTPRSVLYSYSFPLFYMSSLFFLTSLSGLHLQPILNVFLLSPPLLRVLSLLAVWSCELSRVEDSASHHFGYIIYIIPVSGVLTVDRR